MPNTSIINILKRFQRTAFSRVMTQVFFHGKKSYVFILRNIEHKILMKRVCHEEKKGTNSREYRQDKET